jgi:hypothetical protein
VPPEPLAAALPAHVVAGKQLAQNAAVGESANFVPLIREFGYFETPDPGALVAVADIDLRTRRQRGAGVRIQCPFPRAHRTIVLMPEHRW